MKTKKSKKKYRFKHLKSKSKNTKYKLNKSFKRKSKLKTTFIKTELKGGSGKEYTLPKANSINNTESEYSLRRLLTNLPNDVLIKDQVKLITYTINLNKYESYRQRDPSRDKAGRRTGGTNRLYNYPSKSCTKLILSRLEEISGRIDEIPMIKFDCNIYDKIIEERKNNGGFRGLTNAIDPSSMINTSLKNLNKYKYIDYKTQIVNTMIYKEELQLTTYHEHREQKNYSFISYSNCTLLNYAIIIHSLKIEIFQLIIGKLKRDRVYEAELRSYYTGNRYTILHLACMCGRADVAKLLIDDGADKEATNKKKNTPLHLACMCGRYDVAKFLIDNGANKEATSYRIDKGQFDRRNRNNQWSDNTITPLYLAGMYDEIDIVKLLLKNGANIYARHESEDNNGGTLLHSLSKYNEKTDVIKLLIDQLSPLAGVQNNKQNTPIHLAYMYGNNNIAELLIKKTDDIDKSNQDGNTLLHLAAITHNTEIATLLINKRADINATNTYGNTPLHLAIYKYPISTKKKKKEDVFDEDESDEAIFNLLLSRSGIKINAKNKEGNTILHLLAIQCFENELTKEKTDKIIQIFNDKNIEYLKNNNHQFPHDMIKDPGGTRNKYWHDNIMYLKNKLKDLN